MKGIKGPGRAAKHWGKREAAARARELSRVERREGMSEGGRERMDLTVVSFSEEKRREKRSWGAGEKVSDIKVKSAFKTLKGPSASLCLDI